MNNRRKFLRSLFYSVLTLGVAGVSFQYSVISQNKLFNWNRKALTQDGYQFFTAPELVFISMLAKDVLGLESSFTNSYEGQAKFQLFLKKLDRQYTLLDFGVQAQLKRLLAVIRHPLLSWLFQIENNKLKLGLDQKLIHHNGKNHQLKTAKFLSTARTSYFDALRGGYRLLIGTIALNWFSL